MNLPPHKQTMNLLILLDHNILFNPLTFPTIYKNPNILPFIKYLKPYMVEYIIQLIQIIKIINREIRRLNR
jgi:hypothetical protein